MLAKQPRARICGLAGLPCGPEPEGLAPTFSRRCLRAV